MAIREQDGMCLPDEGVGGNRWEGYDLATKYGWMQTGQGPAAVDGGVEYLTALATTYSAVQSGLTADLAKLKVSWQGQSADAAAGAMTKLAGWLSGAGQSTSGGVGSMHDYGSSFAAMKPKIPPPVDVGQQSRGGAVLDAVVGSDIGTVVGLQSAYSQRLQRQAELDAQANAALAAHEASTQAALRSFPAVDEPPVVTSGAGQSPGVDGHSAIAGHGPVPGGRPGGAGVAAPTAGAGAGGSAAGGATSGAGAGGVGAGTHGADSGTGTGTGTGTGGVSGGIPHVGGGAPAGTHQAGWAPPAPTHQPAWTPLPGPGAGGPPGLAPGPAGGFVPTPTRPLPPPAMPPLPPIGSNRPGGVGRGSVVGGGAARPLAERGNPAPASSPPRGGFGEPTGMSPGGPRPGASGGVPMSGMGGAGMNRDDKTHRNNVFIPSDEPFAVPLGDDVVAGVITPDNGGRLDDWR